jgi:hypothetical protein
MENKNTFAEILKEELQEERREDFPKETLLPKKEKKPSFLSLFFTRLFSSFKKKKSLPVKSKLQKVEEQEEPSVPKISPSKEKLEEKPKEENDIQKLKEAEKIYHEGMMTVLDMIAPDSLSIEPSYIQVGDTYARTFFVYSYPRFLEENWLYNIINLDASVDISLFVYPYPSEDIMHLLKKRVGQMRSTLRVYAEKGRNRDPALEIALQDAEELRDQLQKGEEKFFHLGMYITVYAKDKDSLDKLTTEIEARLGANMVISKRANLQMEHGFTSSQPLALDNIQVLRNMNTSPLSTTFPFTSSDLTSDKGILYGINRHNDSLIIFDRFSLENANSVVFATSGAGKSYAVKLEVLRLMMMGVDVIIIDPEKEYQDLCKTVGGEYINISLNARERINPFDLPIPLKDTAVHPGDLLRSAIINLHGLFRLMLGKMTPEEEALLDKALLQCYALKGITLETEDPSKFPPPTLSDLADILSALPGAESLHVRIVKYTEGTFSGLFNCETNVNLSEGMIVFNVRDLEDELRPVAIYIVLNFIWNTVRSSLKKRILVLDEAWSFMQYEDSAKFIHGLVKRARKYWLGITTITQDTEDFISSPYGKPIITNSAMQLLLKQAPSAIENLGKMFNLTEGEKYLLLNSAIGQGIFFAGKKHVACQIIASYDEDKVITTKPEEVLKKQEVSYE